MQALCFPGTWFHYYYQYGCANSVTVVKGHSQLLTFSKAYNPYTKEGFDIPHTLVNLSLIHI